MDFRHLKDQHEELFTFMGKNGYSENYIFSIRKVINFIFSHAENNTWTSYRDVYNDIAHGALPVSLSKFNLKRMSVALTVLEQFDVFGRLPGDGERHSLFKRRAYFRLEGEFKELIDFFCTFEREKGKKSETTIHSIQSCTANFFDYLQRKGIKKFQDITEAAVLSYFVSDAGEVLRGGGSKGYIQQVLTVGVNWNESVCRPILAFLPRLRHTRKNIQYLTKEEISAFRKLAESKKISLRNRAILLLLMYTGLRSSDIAALKLENLDWDNNALHISQQKTGQPLNLPLSPVVGNAIYDYLVEERRESKEYFVFLSEKRPFSRVGSQSIRTIVRKLFKAAGIRQKAGDRKGSHLFRHHLASSLLENGIPQPVITQTLGHTSPRSLEPYLRADFVHLKECALSLDDFPLNEEVFLL